MTQYVDVGDPNWIGATDISFYVGMHGRQIQEVVEAFKGIGYVAGGAARYLLIRGAPEPKDIDVFLFGLTFDVSPLEELGYKYQNGPERAPFYQRYENELRVQVVRPEAGHPTRTSFGAPLEVLSNFTFHTEQFAIWQGTGEATGLLSIMGKTMTEQRILSNNRISNPVLSIYRLNKYGQKGYGVSMGSVQEIASALRDLTDDEYGAVMLDALSMVS